MSRRGAKIKIMKQKDKNGEDDKKDLLKMFNQITGVCDADRLIIIPKIDKIYKSVVEYNKLYSVLLNFPTFTDQFKDYSFWFDDIKEFLQKLIKSLDVDITKKYGDPLETTDMPWHTMDDAKLNVFYKDLKDNDFLKKMIITGNNLAPYKRYLVGSVSNVLDDAFIYREPGLTLTPLSFSTLDLKVIWGTADINNKAKQFILSILKHTYKIGIEVYDIITSPDVDIKKFSKILVDSIGKMKKQIPRCDKAFKIIENSVSMLESNFKSYFRGSVEAGNPSIIIESFIVDISTSQKASPTVAREFREIVAFLKQNSAQNNDPKVKRLFSMLNNQFASLDAEMGVKTTSAPVKDDFDLDIEKDLQMERDLELAAESLADNLVTELPSSSHQDDEKKEEVLEEVVIASDDDDYEKISASICNLKL